MQIERKIVEKNNSAMTPLHILEKIMDAVAVVMFIVIFIVAMAQVLMRWIFNNPLIWSEELIRLMFVWICFLGWVMATRHNTHITITAVISKLPPMGQKIMKTFNLLIVIVFSVLMVVFGIQMAKMASITKAVSMPFISFTLVYAICPFSNAVIVIYQIINIVNLWKGNDSDGKGA